MSATLGGITSVGRYERFAEPRRLTRPPLARASFVRFLPAVALPPILAISFCRDLLIDAKPRSDKAMESSFVSLHLT